MSEEPPQSSENDFMHQAASRSGNFFKEHPKTTKAIAVGAIVGAGAAITTVELTNPTPNQVQSAAIGKERLDTQRAWDKLIDAAEKKAIDRSRIVGSPIVVKPVTSLYDQGLERVDNLPGFKDNQSDAQLALLKSSRDIGMTQPGEIFDVVSVDLKKNGKEEFIVVDPSKVGYETSNNDGPLVNTGSGDSIPAPSETNNN